MLENLKKLEDSGKVGGGEYFKVQNGNNIIRVLTEGIYHESEYKDKTGKVSITKKFVMFIIDRRDKQVKPYFAPYAVYKAIASLEEDPFYKFQGMPMPYDINVKVENAGTLNAEYNVQASPTKTELTGEEIAAAREKGSIQDYVNGLDKQESQSAPETPADVVARASGGKFTPRQTVPSDADLPPDPFN
jgi:hypothetical protein